MTKYLTEAGATNISVETGKAPLYPQAGQIGEWMTEDYKQIISSHVPALGKLYKVEPEVVQKQGLEVLADCEVVRGFNTFYTAIGQRP